MSNWFQNRKNHNFKGNKILQTIDFKGFEKKSQKTSTQLLTLLIGGGMLCTDKKLALQNTEC